MKLLKRLTIFISLLFLCFFIISIRTSADNGPKPQTYIEIYNLEKTDYIVTYLVKTEDDYYGPHKTFEVLDEQDYYGNYNALKKVYENIDIPKGFKMLDISYQFTDVDSFSLQSGYYWPNEYILVIYKPITNVYYLSEYTKNFAFHSYFKCDFSNVDRSFELTKDYSNPDVYYNPDDGYFELEQNYNWWPEMFGFFFRLLVCLAIEMTIAYFFKFTKKSYLIILLANVITQIGLNLSLSIYAHFNGIQPLLIPFYVIIELIILLVEGTIYKFFCKRGKLESTNWIYTYSLIANALSFIVGMIFWFIM